MSHCIHCGNPRPAGAAGEYPSMPLESLEESTESAPRRLAGPQTGIARFQNGADAGYFADELSRQTGIEVEVVARERFDATHAQWLIDYVLHVAHDDAPRAATALKALVESTDDGGDGADHVEPPLAARATWMPLMLTLAAGSLACWGIQHVDHRPRAAALVARERREIAVPAALLQLLRGTWVQREGEGHSARELSVDLERQTATLTEDHDNDGQPDQRWEFPLRQAAARR